jgi:hypothetical protein
MIEPGTLNFLWSQAIVAGFVPSLTLFGHIFG